MKFTKIIVIALLLNGALFAGEPVYIKIKNDNVFLKTKPQLSFRKNSIERNPLKLSNGEPSKRGKVKGDKDMTSSGLFLNFGLCFPAGSSGNSGPGFGSSLEVGSFFRLTKPSPAVLGLRATWFGFDYSFITGNIFGGFEQALSATAAKVGPQGTFAFNDKIAVDVFYQLGPNYTIYRDPIYAYNDSQYFFGVVHELGVCFRIKAFSVGSSFRLGNLQNTEASDDRLSSYDIANFKLNFGFKF